MEQTTLINEHFFKWRKEAAIPEDHFHEDGIISEEEWIASTVKLCFLMKEPNNPPKDGIQKKFDFREWWIEEVKYRFSRVLSLWAAGVQSGFPVYESLHPQIKHAALRSSALVNVKKTGGKGSTALHELLPYVQRDKELILEELRIIDPEVIIMGLSNPPVIRHVLFPDVKWKSSGYDILIGNWEGCTLIDFYHPSSYNASAASYCLLQKVMGSVAFTELREASMGERRKLM